MAGTDAVAKKEASLGVACAMQDLRFVATELKQLQSEKLLPPDTTDKVLPMSLGLPSLSNATYSTLI